jgi:hypothetical protein
LDDRGLYYDFRELGPGPICSTEAELYDAIMATLDDSTRVKQFVAEYFGEVPKDNAKRFAEFIVEFINRDGLGHAKLKEIEEEVEPETHQPQSGQECRVPDKELVKS